MSSMSQDCENQTPKEREQQEDRERVGDYILQEGLLGVGSFGKVKLAIHAESQEKKVAVKIVDKKTISDIHDVERVYRETAILTTLKHQNIIRLLEVVDTQDSVMLVMEYAPGGDLLKFLDRRKVLSERETCQMLHQLIAGIEYCHRKNVIHRDLKLENILLDEQGGIKIADFGLSNTLQFGQNMRTPCGTPSYTSPEQVQHEHVGASTDIWSLGVILFTMMCGFLPFVAVGIPLLFRKIVSGQFIVPQYISKEGRDLLQRMLTVDPEERISIVQIRSHPWFLMEYSDLGESLDIPAQRDEIEEARKQRDQLEAVKRLKDTKPTNVTESHQIRQKMDRSSNQQTSRERGRADLTGGARGDTAKGFRLTHLSVDTSLPPVTLRRLGMSKTPTLPLTKSSTAAGESVKKAHRPPTLIKSRSLGNSPRSSTRSSGSTTVRRKNRFSRMEQSLKNEMKGMIPDSHRRHGNELLSIRIHSIESPLTLTSTGQPSSTRTHTKLKLKSWSSATHRRAKSETSCVPHINGNDNRYRSRENSCGKESPRKSVSSLTRSANSSTGRYSNSTAPTSRESSRGPQGAAFFRVS